MTTKPDFSLTDPATWLTIASIVAAVVLNVFHRDVSSYVPAFAVLAAGAVTAGVALGKHHYSAALGTAAASVVTADSRPPAGPGKDVLDKAAALASAASQLAALVGPQAGAELTPAIRDAILAQPIQTAPGGPGSVPPVSEPAPAAPAAPGAAQAG